MNCEQVRDKISLYIDDVLSPEEKNAFEKHMKECKECYGEYLSLIDLVNSIHGIHEKPLPEEFKQELREKLEEAQGEKQNLQQGILRKGFKKWGAIASIVLAGFILIAAFILPNISFMGSDSSMGSEDKGIQEQYESSEEARDEAADFHGESQNSLEATDQSNNDLNNSSQEKIIYSANMTLKVEEFQKSFNEIMKYTKDVGGFIENSSIFNPEEIDASGNGNRKKEGRILIRVPVENFEEALMEIEKLGRVESKNRSGTNVTSQYRDIEIEVKNLEVQEKRLLEIMKEAEKTQDLLQIEKELNRIRTEINQRKSILKNLDQRVEYSSIEIYVVEEKIASGNLQGSPFKDLLGKIQKGFIHSINLIIAGAANLLVLIAKIIPFIIIIIILYIIYIKVLRDRIKDKINK